MIKLVNPIRLTLTFALVTAALIMGHIEFTVGVLAGTVVWSFIVD